MEDKNSFETGFEFLHFINADMVEWKVSNVLLLDYKPRYTKQR